MNRSKNLIKVLNNVIINNNGNKNLNFPLSYISTNVSFQSNYKGINTGGISKRNYFTNNKIIFSQSSNKNESINEQKQSPKIEETQQQQPQEPLKTEETIQPKTEDNTQPKTEETTQQQQQQQQQQTQESPKTEDNTQPKAEEQSKTENNEQQQQQQQQQTEQEKPKTLKEKIISKLKWGTIIGSITGSIFFLFYESYLRGTLPYRMTMKLVDNDVDVLRAFGGHITGIKWYKCFLNPIFGWVQNEEGGYNSWTVLRIPITRFIAPPPPAPKDGQPPIEPIVLPEDELFKGYDGGVQEGIIYARLDKNSANFFDWRFEDLQIHCDNQQVIKIVDSEKNKVKV
ncbi:hypothetical protein ACTFIZ_005264 [Dictyostelium cf. discoideum]